ISTRSPGGLLLGREGEEGTRRYRAFLHYQADIPQHSETSPSGNTVTHNINGGIAYRFPFGLTLSLNNEFSRSYERLDSVLSGGEVDRFRGNLLYLSASLDTGSRLRLRVDYSNFLLRYDADRNDRLNRDDNFFSAYVFYRLWPRTALFAQYTFTDIRYTDNATTNSKEHGLLGGFDWDMTAKTRGSVKAGWGKKDFTDFSTSNFIYEGKVDHRFSPKASVSVTAFGQTSETNIPAAFYTLDRGAIVNFQHMVSSRVTGWASFSYTNQKYGQPLTFDGKTEKRRDNYYEASAGIDYWFKKGLKAGISYAFATRKSNISAFDYQSNTVVFNIKGAI
ncbi:MAG TPA: outer membrane beta-barrel protein, partial [Dissulfurispiraceae bacterium]|nr:outer membrane beta-barrel protein [Dissulfurispiraceae bacterium]